MYVIIAFTVTSFNVTSFNFFADSVTSYIKNEISKKFMAARKLDKK